MMAAQSVDFVIVAFRNEASELFELTSALNRHTGQGRVIVVANDDAEYSVPDDAIVIQGHGNVGFAAGVRLGVLAGEADYVVIVNPDCVVDQRALSRFVAEFRPGCGILVPKLLTEHGEFDYYPYENWTFAVGRKLAEARCRRELTLPRGAELPGFAKIPGAFIGLERRVALALDSPFDSTFFLYAEDRDLTDRARRSGVPIRFLSDIEITHIGGLSGSTVSHLVETCKTDGSMRIAYRRFGRLGAVLFALDTLVVDVAKQVLKRGAGPKPHVAALRRWARSWFADPGALSSAQLHDITEPTSTPRDHGSATRTGQRRVLALWADNRAANLGLRVLAQGSSALVEKATDGTYRVDFQDFGPGDSDVSFGTRSILRDFGRRNGPIKTKLRQYEFVLDTGAGDSFADIYGLKRLAFIAYAHRVLRQLRIPLVLGPQTIGPFNTRLGRILARRSLRQASLLMTRDAASAEYSANILGRRVDVIGTDVVFMLPVAPENARSRDVIVNISGLLWFGDDHVDSGHYREQVRRLVEGLEAQGRTVSLLAHVVNSERGNDDVDAIEAAVRAFDRADIELLVPADLDEVRAFIATSNVVVGARMHACLNALSQGVPAIPWAYSRKFEPLLAGVGWPHVLDLRSEPDIAGRTLDMLLDDAISRRLAAQAREVADSARARVIESTELLASWLSGRQGDHASAREPYGLVSRGA